jgi:hypothetical protein
MAVTGIAQGEATFPAIPARHETKPFGVCLNIGNRSASAPRLPQAVQTKSGSMSESRTRSDQQSAVIVM